MYTHVYEEFKVNVMMGGVVFYTVRPENKHSNNFLLQNLFYSLLKAQIDGVSESRDKIQSQRESVK